MYIVCILCPEVYIFIYPMLYVCQSGRERDAAAQNQPLQKAVPPKNATNTQLPPQGVHTHTHQHILEIIHTNAHTHIRAQRERDFQLPLFEFGIFQYRLPRLTFQSAALVVVLVVVGGGGVCVRVYMLHARAVNRYKRQKKWQLCPVYFSLLLLYSYAYIISN